MTHAETEPLPPSPLPPSPPISSRRHRVRDGLIGAAILLAIQVLMVVAGWFALSDPITSVTGGPPPTAGAQAGSDPDGTAPDTPDDLTASESWLADLEAGGSSVVFKGTRLDDVDVRLTGLRSGPDGTTIAEVEATGRMPYAELAARLGDGATAEYVDEDHVHVTRPVRLGGRELQVGATATVTAQGRVVTVTPTSVEVSGAGVPVPRSLLTVRTEIDQLPTGMQITDVTPRDDGVQVHLTGQNVTLG
ncbi:MAG: LmeA family phospholipid-binding protein [Actinomycetales bacterium]